MRRSTPALLLAVALAVPALPLGAAAPDPVKLTDVRVAMDDGVTLAADVYVPSVPDGDGDGRYPCVVELTPYRKESRAAEAASFLPQHGIALIEVDARGTGGSEGEYDVVFSVREQADAARWVDWAATRATKDGKAPLPGGENLLCEPRVGMFGGSYSGIIQYLAASLPLGPGDEGWGRLPTGSRHLAAIAPQRAYGDLYRDIVYHGGQLIASFGTIWSSGTSAYYYQPPTDMPADAARAAWGDHVSQNDPMLRPYIERPYADATWSSEDGLLDGEPYTQRLYEDSSLLSRVRNLRVPTLHVAGWFDSFTRGQLLAFSQAHELERRGPGRGPNFLVVGPWNHGGTHLITPDQGLRQHTLDWYRWWLEDVEHGGSAPHWIAGGFDGSGARALWFEMRSGKVNRQSAEDGTWRTSATWPPSGLDVEQLYPRAGGLLSTQAPSAEGDGSGTYAFLPLSGAGESLSRWDNAAGVPQQEWDQRVEDGRGLTYLTGPLPGDLRIAGPAVLRMVASTTGAPGNAGQAADWPGAAQAMPPYHDTDWVVKVSEVAPDGSARLVTGGWLRASHRAVDASRTQRWKGEPLMPFHPHTLAALEPPEPGAPLEYLVEVWPTAKVFRKDHRLRVDITSADAPSHLNVLRPALNEVLHEARTYLALPVLR